MAFLLVVLLSVLTCLLLLNILNPAVGGHIYYQLRLRLPSWFCDFRKGPLLQLIDDRKLLLTLETCHLYSRLSLTLDNQKRIEKFEVSQLNPAGYLYRVLIDWELAGGLKSYEISLETESTKLTKKFNVDFPPITTATNYSVAIFGDGQTGFDVFRSLAKASAQHRPNLLLHLGDMVQRPQPDYDWQTYFFDPIEAADYAGTTPFLITLGNHDVYHGGIPVPYFARYQNFSPARDGYYYAVSLGAVRWIILDSNRLHDKQKEWMVQELKSESSRSAQFRIVCVHVPPFIEFWEPEAWRNGGESQWPEVIQKEYVPIFEASNVNLVLSGHQHNYQRGHLNGIAYVICGGGGARIDAERVEQLDMYKSTHLAHHYCLLKVSSRELTLRSYGMNGRQLDEISISKSKTH